MKPDWEWMPLRGDTWGLYLTEATGTGYCLCTILRKNKRSYYIVGNDEGGCDQNRENCPVLADNIRSLKTAKIAYLLHASRSDQWEGVE